jgi:protein-disulfide isomerase
MHKGTYFALAAITVVGGFALGRALKSSDDQGGGTAAETAPAPMAAGGAVPGDVDRKRVPLEGEFRGPADALVNIVVFSDFQCPFCGRVNPSLEKLIKDYPGKVRVFFKHFPLNFHQDAPLASQAALAAGAQGKFWDMHDKLFEHQQALKRPDLDRYAKELGLDEGKFKQALDSNAFKARVDADMALGTSVGVSGTPASFVNGRLVSGAVPYGDFQKIVDEEIATANKLIAQGTPKARVYEKLMAGAGTGAAAPSRPTAAAPAVPGDIFKVAVGNGAAKGGKQPKVTIVEFSEFQCPFCSRAQPTLQQIQDTYKDDVQIVFKHLPLPMHNNAELAAVASEAAHEQGKFWQMHDKMFANQQALDRPSLEKYAQEIGLDLGRFKAALDSGKFKAKLDGDKAQATQFGVTGTPTFFLNGRKMVGASPFPEFKTVIDQEIAKADEKLKAGVARKDLYAALTKDGLEKVAAPAAPPARPGQPAPDQVMKAEIAGAPSKGAKDALVTIVVFSDFQCPFCSRVEPTLDRIMEENKGKVKVVWRDFPLDFHQDAIPAAIAARVAGESGKFWDMHKKLFENQRQLDRASLEKYAGELGLNVAKLKSALDTKKYEDAIKADMAMGTKIGVRGTPASFVNGTFLSGAQPYEAFKARVDAEMAKAEAMVKSGVPRAKLYAEIMKKAGAAPAPAAAAREPGAEPEPDQDETVHEVVVGKAPARGPKNAPITMVVFSDFQCPFCSKVEPTIERLEREYPGKIRVVWKDFPLNFHQNAKPAAIAARVAGESGKFWQMHKKLFENQSALDRPSLERYAGELGLDVGKMKAALDSNKYGADIDADMAAGSKLGVSGTPATFVNGRKIGGAYPYETFKKIVDQELAKAKKRS